MTPCAYGNRFGCTSIRCTSRDLLDSKLSKRAQKELWEVLKQCDKSGASLRIMLTATL